MNPVFRFSRDCGENRGCRPWSVDSGRRRSGRSQHPLPKLSDFSPDKQREMESASPRMARQIHGSKTRSLKRERTERVGVAHSLRNNVHYEGIPFAPVLKAPPRTEATPHVVVHYQPLHA
jgi:hypothetical protein